MMPRATVRLIVERRRMLKLLARSRHGVDEELLVRGRPANVYRDVS